jgi:hypothetical protein
MADSRSNAVNFAIPSNLHAAHASAIKQVAEGPGIEEKKGNRDDEALRFYQFKKVEKKTNQCTGKMQHPHAERENKRAEMFFSRLLGTLLSAVSKQSSEI